MDEGVPRLLVYLITCKLLSCLSQHKSIRFAYLYLLLFWFIYTFNELFHFAPTPPSFGFVEVATPFLGVQICTLFLFPPNVYYSFLKVFCKWLGFNIEKPVKFWKLNKFGMKQAESYLIKPT